MKKPICLFLVVVLALAVPAHHFAQILFPTIVFDPSVDASIGTLTGLTTSNQIQQILNQIEQIKTAVDTYLELIETYKKVKETFDLAKKMSQFLSGLGAYALATGNWQNAGGAKDVFGTTGGIQEAMSGVLTPRLGPSYIESTNQLNAYDAATLGAMTQLEKDRIEASAATVAIADGASQQSFATVGSVGGAIEDSESRVKALTEAALSDDPDMNTYAALLNRINVASAYQLATQQDTNKLLSVISNAQAVTLKAERDGYADAINVDIYLRNNFKKDWKWSFAGADEAVKSFKLSDWVKFN